MAWDRRADPGRDLLEQGIAQLMDLFGKGWRLRLQQDETEPVDRGISALLRVGQPGGQQVVMIVEVKSNLTPSDAARAVGPRLELARQQRGGDAAALVISPWLSPRTRRVLEEQGLGYLDLTGNVSISIDDPVVRIRTDGNQRDPRPPSRGRRGLSGPRAGRLVRELVDFREPRRATELAKATGISESYISRLLELLGEEALIRRSKRVIIKIDWQGLLRSRAETYQLMKANHVSPAITRIGLDRTFSALRDNKIRHEVLATGSFAAQGFAPTAVGGALMLYVPPGPRVVEEVAQDLGLLRVDHASVDVLLLQPMSDGAMDRPHPQRVDGVPIVGLSQLVLDCLSGPGRLPAEGEALLEWMTGHEDEWRSQRASAECPQQLQTSA
ncbi:MAG: hypothetical protein ACRDTZ_15145 [Pseudonocardiaceae bacterium]